MKGRKAHRRVGAPLFLLEVKIKDGEHAGKDEDNLDGEYGECLPRCLRRPPDGEKSYQKEFSDEPELEEVSSYALIGCRLRRPGEEKEPKLHRQYAER